MLHQLPNGNWIDPADVRGIDANPGRKSEVLGVPFGFKDHIQVNLVGGKCRIVDFDTFEAACKARDELAAVVNAAKPANTTNADLTVRAT